MKVGKYFRRAEGDLIMFYCPGCKTHHFIDHRWDCTGLEIDSPTITPSILVNGGRVHPGEPTCHLYIKNGMIEYLSDCTHDLAGKTIPMEEQE